MKILPNPDFAGLSVLIVASGPSAGMVDPEDMSGFVERHKCVVIGVNNAWDIIHGFPLDADYVVMLDKDFWDKNKNSWVPYHQMFRPVPVLGFPDSHFTPKESIRIQIDIQRHAQNKPAYERGRYFHSLSSGCAAVQFATHCRASEIFLLGHDLRIAAGKTHGNGVRTHHELQMKYPQGKAMIDGYRLAHEHAVSLGINVFNLSPVSVLDFIRRGCIHD